MSKTLGGSKKSRRARNRRRAKSRRRSESRIEMESNISSGHSRSSPENSIAESLRNNPSFRQIMNHPSLSEYYANFNLIPGRKYRINDSEKEFMFAGETKDIGQGPGYTFIYLENGEPIYMSNGKPLTQTHYNIKDRQITFKLV